MELNKILTPQFLPEIMQNIWIETDHISYDEASKKAKEKDTAKNKSAEKEHND